eukprot:CAMPEP_0197033330 /NCGR_PEP_ID=MMETSP1384-20130603/11770_1 /TAXON_ID=29189 /ORGANISM="Ammonia sp." /LENGTH=205 /DNA_ID=CAMNT_0042463125 /DNA_START=73 /DNA_END=690 /DNA_ORIENTATION=-
MASSVNTASVATQQDTVTTVLTKRELLSSRSLPFNYSYSHTLPASKRKCVQSSILNNLSEDTSFKYLPLLSRYQISTKPYCDTCFGVLDALNQSNYFLHLQTPHSYPCSNKGCDRQFVSPEHLRIHEKICKECEHLISDVRKMDAAQFEALLKYVMASPMPDYFDFVDKEQVLPNQEWIDAQIEWRKQHKKGGKKSKLKQNAASK